MVTNLGWKEGLHSPDISEIHLKFAWNSDDLVGGIDLEVCDSI